MLTGLDTLVFGLVLAGILIVGLVASRGVKSAKDWLVAGRSMGLLTLVGTLVMTELNTATMLAFSAQAYLVGPWALTLPLVFLVGLGTYTLLVAKRYKRLNATSVAELYGARFGPGLQRLASLCFLVAMLGFVATYVRSAELVFAPVLESWVGASLSPWLTSGVLVLLVLAVTLAGGLKAVAASDLAAFVVTLLGLPVLAWMGLRAVGGWSQVTTFYDGFAPGTERLPPRFVASLVLLTAFTYMASPWYGQRMFAAKDERTAFRGVGLSAVLVTGLYMAASVLAMCFRVQVPSLADAQTALPGAISAWAPSGLRGLGFAVLLAVVLSTMSSIWNTWVAMALTDLWAEISLPKSRWATVALALASWVLSNLLVDDILDNMILANVPIAALAFGLLGGLFWGGASRAGAWAATVAGVIGALTCWAFVPLYTWWWAVAAVPLSFVVGVFVSLLWPDPPERAEAFYARTGAPWFPGGVRAET